MPLEYLDNPDFMAAWEFAFAHEGKYGNDPDDPGGETKYGISKKTYPYLDIASLTQEQAQQIYYRDWWCDKLSFLDSKTMTQAMKVKIFDIGINVGPKTVVFIMQRALNACHANILEDGVYGRQTSTAINNVHPEHFLAAFRATTAGHYRTLMAANPKLTKYRNGWIKRAYA